MKCKQVVQHLKLFQMITDVFCYGFKSFSGDDSSPKPILCVRAKNIIYLL